MAYKLYFAAQPGGPYQESMDAWVEGNTGSFSLPEGAGFFRVEAVPMPADELLTSIVLSRLSYGPTPEELERVRSMGPQAYIEEQLAPEQVVESLEIDRVINGNEWQLVTVTGTASSSSLYVYLTSAGDAYLDDIKLVAGTVAGAGVNLLRNGDFEVPLRTNDWMISSNHLGSAIVSDVVHGGLGALHLVASSGGTTRASAVWQDIVPGLTQGRAYTLSYWYRAGASPNAGLVLRLSGEGIVSSPGTLMTRLVEGNASITDFRAWHILRAVQTRRQLLEVLDQFLENHFVTEYSKSRDYLDRYYDSGTVLGQVATQLEFKENRRWREALLRPQCTFGDLLRISAESPAMIIYLDTVTSRGDGRNIANENYARELLELFTFGVDNGYDQADIVELSKVWTGWSVEYVAPADENNPHAVRSTLLKPGVTNNLTSVSNLVGVWTFNYKPSRHHAGTKTLFPGKVVPERFGAPYAGRSYAMTVAGRSGTAGLQEGYEVLAQLADQPFTQEFISVKLCRLFVHDGFHLGYDFTAPDLSPEAALVRACMNAWESSTPKGQIRAVLATIFNSALFRSHDASLQKVKTPLEFVVSAVRALRAAVPGGGYTADTDGASLGVSRGPMDRMGGMNLFDRAEPDGYPEGADGWISAGTLTERLRFVQSLLLARGQDGKSEAGANTVTDPVGLLRIKLPSNVWSDANSIAEFFVGILYPGEGRANLDFYRGLAVSYLNTADDGRTASPLAGLSQQGTGSNPSPYEVRVRGMVAMLMTQQRFQEQ
jgi:uncharacterized protein (DUF1800 family)